MGELRQLVRPYYVLNLVLCGSFIVLKTVSPLCDFLFAASAVSNKEVCELDMRENEILFFLLIVVMIRSRKTGSTGSAVRSSLISVIIAKKPVQTEPCRSS
jgi:hypothetical protein